MHTVLIRNIDCKTPDLDKKIRHAFSQFGNVNRIRLVRDSYGAPKGFGYCFYADAKGVDIALRNSGFYFGSKKIIVEKIASPRKVKSPTRSPTAEVAENSYKSVGRFSSTVGWQSVREQKLSSQETSLRQFFRKLHEDGPEFQNMMGPYLESQKQIEEYNNSFSNYLALVQQSESAAIDLSREYANLRELEIRCDALRRANEDLIMEGSEV